MQAEVNSLRKRLTTSRVAAIAGTAFALCWMPALCSSGIRSPNTCEMLKPAVRQPEVRAGLLQEVRLVESKARGGAAVDWDRGVNQRPKQATCDRFLGWTTGTDAAGRHFFLRQLGDTKIRPVVEITKEANLKNYARLCGMALARVHARSADAAVLSGYMDKSTAFQTALADFGVAYADQNERDDRALVNAIRSGRIEVRTAE